MTQEKLFFFVSYNTMIRRKIDLSLDILKIFGFFLYKIINHNK